MAKNINHDKRKVNDLLREYNFRTLDCHYDQRIHEHRTPQFHFDLLKTRALLRLERTMNLFGGRGGRGRGGGGREGGE